jgi:DNA-binding MarR family transcriptional regulator
MKVAALNHAAAIRFEASEIVGIGMGSSQISIETVLNLSELQIRILLWLYDTTVYVEQELGFIFPWGIQWTFSQNENMGEYSDQALSRSLQRLESRGLLVRSNHLRDEVRISPYDPPPSRTTSVKLTVIGREVAELIIRACTTSS